MLCVFFTGLPRWVKVQSAPGTSSVVNLWALEGLSERMAAGFHHGFTIGIPKSWNCPNKPGSLWWNLWWNPHDETPMMKSWSNQPTRGKTHSLIMIEYHRISGWDSTMFNPFFPTRNKMYPDWLGSSLNSTVVSEIEHVSAKTSVPSWDFDRWSYEVDVKWLSWWNIKLQQTVGFMIDMTIS